MRRSAHCSSGVRWPGVLERRRPPPRLAAPADCSTNPNCAPGLKRVYGVERAQPGQADGRRRGDPGARRRPRRGRGRLLLQPVAVAPGHPHAARRQAHDRRRPRRAGRAHRRCCDRYGAAAAPAAERRLAAARHARAARAQPAGDRRPAARGGRRRVHRRQRARRRPAGAARARGSSSATRTSTRTRRSRTCTPRRCAAPASASAVRGVGGLRQQTVARAASRPHRAVPGVLRLAARVPRRHVAARGAREAATPSRWRSRRAQDRNTFAMKTRHARARSASASSPTSRAYWGSGAAARARGSRPAAGRAVGRRAAERARPARARGSSRRARA